MMRERRRIVALAERSDVVALATLARVEGSSYRRVGARMLILASGEAAGSVSGGCLEAEVIRKAQWLVRDGATLQRYSTLFDDTAEIPYGLGCGGTVDLLLEPAGTPEFNAHIAALAATLCGEQRRIITQLPSSTTAFARQVFDAKGTTLFHSEAGLDTAPELLLDEILTPPQRLILCGAGDDAQPLVSMAALLGWTAIVLDGRPQWARAERFPEAEQVRTAEPGPEAIAGLHLGPEDAVVLMTHSYEQDRAWLAAVLPHQPRYLGLLGSRHRSALLVSEAATMLGWSVDRACEHLFAPVGLDLGGDGAEAIALAILSEVQACCAGKLGHSRRMTPQMVAAQIEQGGASRYLQTQCAL